MGTPKASVQVSFHGLKMEVVDTTKKAGNPCVGGAKETKVILKEISGIFEPGCFTAIMGASGAGKTTLLNAVAGEAAGGKLSGNILLNGDTVPTDIMRKLRAFVFQDDVMMGTMTVREVIRMSARLRLPQSMSNEEKENRVEQVIELLHLDRCKDTVIGYPGQKGGISGGERKRTGIAIELITNPTVLFLDEPTSGLDTYTATSVCETLKHLAMSGRTVVATIHQPSSEIFHMFDRLLLLARGEIMYQGDAQEAMTYFSAEGFPCPQYTNPADHIFMKILNDQGAMTPEAKEAASARVDKLLNKYKTSDRCKQILRNSVASGPGVAHDDVHATASLFVQLQVLFSRAKSNALRNRMILRAKLGQGIFMGLLVGLVYLDLGTNQKAIQDRTGALFFLAVNLTMSATFGVLSAFGLERVVFERERSIGMYSTIAYFVSKIVVELPHNVIIPFIQSQIAYFMLGLQWSVWKWLSFWVTVVTLNNVGNAFGIVIGCMFRDLEATLAVAPLFILPLMLFSGLFVNSGGIPPYFDWIKYISPMKYSFESFMLAEQKGLTYYCDDDELVVRDDCAVKVDADGVVMLRSDGTPQRQACYCPVSTGDQVLTRMDMNDNLTIGENILVLVALWVGFLSLAFTLLHRLVASREAERAKLLSNTNLKEAQARIDRTRS